MALSSVVSPSESLGRYLPEESYFSRARNEVKFKAFMPPRNLRLSIYRIDGLRIDEIWEMGQQNVINAMAQPKILYGLADIKAEKIEEATLQVIADAIPSRHANIVGWPEEQAKQMSIAHDLAAEAKLILK